MTDTPLPELTLRRGGVARLLKADGEHASLDMPFASPPGSTLELIVAGAALGVKVQSCKRSTPPEEVARFRVDGRWVNLQRPQREALGIALPKSG